jgi:hypothetical protein
MNILKHKLRQHILNLFSEIQCSLDYMHVNKTDWGQADLLMMDSRRYRMRMVPEDRPKRGFNVGGISHHMLIL